MRRVIRVHGFGKDGLKCRFVGFLGGKRRSATGTNWGAGPWTKLHGCRHGIAPR
jgi:hypothetical protein